MKRAYLALIRTEAILAGLFLLGMAALIFLGGIARLVRMPLNWTTDFATALFAWSCFFCADIAWRRGGLMSIDILTARLSGKAQRILRFANYAILTIFLLYLAGAGIWLSWLSRARSFQGIPAISYSWVTMSLPVGALLLLITTALKVRDELRGEPPAGAAPSET
jgi:TRAP-type C4-dicarboxylate transport system permease small subunit